MAQKAQEFINFAHDNPCSMCACGHTGDGGNSQHETGGFQQGHGACTVDGCHCIQFTWDGWLPEAKLKLGLK